MSVSENERSLRRRLLCTALPSSTAPALLQTAMDLLENEFGDEPNIRYSALVKRLREQLDQHVDLSGVLTKIMVLRNKPDTLGPDPFQSGSQPVARGKAEPNASAANARQRRTTSQLATLQPKFQVFNCLFAQIIEKISVRSESLVGELAECLATSSSSSLKGFEEWKQGEEPRIVGTDEELHKLVNGTFVWMCGKFGPVDADRVLADAVRKAEQLPEAFENPPRSFL